MDGTQLVELVLMEQRLRTQWAQDEHAWHIQEARHQARKARGPWWAGLVPRRSRSRAASPARPVVAPAGA